jgi:hypothetical protein
MAKTVIVSGDKLGVAWGKQNSMNTELYEGIDRVLKSVRYALVFDSAGSVNIGSPVPLNSRVHKTIISVTTAFDGTTESTLTVGDVGDLARFCGVDEVNLAEIGIYDIDNHYNYGSISQILGTYVQDGATVGAASIEVLYSIA